MFEAVKSDVAQSSIRIGHMGTLKSTHPDYYAGAGAQRGAERQLHVAALLHGAHAEGAGVLGRRRRRQQLHARRAVCDEHEHEDATTAETIETLIGEARRIIAEPPTEEEIVRAKQSILNSFVFSSATTEQVLGQQVTYEYYGLPTDWLERYRAGIEKVTAADTARVARQYIKPEQFAILVVGPTEGRDKPLSDVRGGQDARHLDPRAARPRRPRRRRAPPRPAAEEAGRALVSKAVDAMGGAAAIDGVKAYREETTVAATTPQGEIELQSTVLVAPPDRVRQELVTPMGAMTMTIAGASGTVQGGPQGSMPLPETQRTQMLKQVQRSPIFLLQRRGQPGFKAVAAGEGTVGGTAVTLVRVEVDGDAMTLGIDPKTGPAAQPAGAGRPGRPAPRPTCSPSTTTTAPRAG